MLASETQKHYKVGFVAGTFDLFHVGHLNLLRRASERCDYLYVGVLEDTCGNRKRKWPIIPQHERLAIVKAIRYVDEAVLLAAERAQKMEIWQDYHYDVFFSGDDYINDPVWQKEERLLAACGADLLYFPYTRERSSTTVQEAILPPKPSASRVQKLGEKGEGFRFLFPFDKVGHDERIVIYGAGEVGVEFARQVTALGYCTIVAFADQNSGTSGFGGYPVWPPELLPEKAAEYGRIVVASTRFYDAMVSRLRNLGIGSEQIV